MRLLCAKQTFGRPPLPAHAKEVPLRPSRKVGGQPADDRASYLAPRARLVDCDDRFFGIRDTTLPGALERQAHGLREPFSPEIRSHPRD
jgi:hypothetical protein